MTFNSNVPTIEFTPEGLVIPQESAILDGVIEDIDAAFGGGLNPALETPQGQLASSQAASTADKNNEIAYIVNQVDPSFASGTFQDAIARIYFLNRKAAIATTASVILTGNPGTVIPVGTLAQDTSTNTYASLGEVTIGVSGNVEASFANIETGPIPLAANNLTQVYQSIPGWDLIDNPAAGVTGSVVESRADFEYRRINSVALNGHGSLPSIYASVFNIEDVLDVYAVDNTSNTTVNVGPTNYPLLPHSLYVAVVGGVDADIAQAIWDKKDLGCDYNGNTTVQITDQEGYSFPYPTYNVTFNRPASLQIKFEVDIVDDPSLPSDIVSLVQNAVLDRFTGQDEGARARIGASIFASSYYGAISATSPVVSILSVLVSGGAGPLANTVEVGIDQSPTLDINDVTVNLI